MSPPDPLPQLPMPTPTNAPLSSLASHKVLTFDVYGTLVDYKPAIFAALRPVLDRAPSTSSWHPSSTSTSADTDSTVDMTSDLGARLLNRFKHHEDDLTLGRPLRPFRQVLHDIYLRIASDIGVPSTESAEIETEAVDFGNAISQLPVYPDTMEALRRLEGMGFKLVFLSNIEKEASGVTLGGELGEVKWWRTFTASDFVDAETGGLDRDADLKKLQFVMEKVAKEFKLEGDHLQRKNILHVANSLGHDHVHCKTLGLSSAWIVREAVRWGKEKEMKEVVESGKVGYGWKFMGLKEFADAMEVERDNAS